MTRAIPAIFALALAVSIAAIWRTVSAHGAAWRDKHFDGGGQ
jgi:hypothetical protein